MSARDDYPWTADFARTVVLDGQPLAAARQCAAAALDEIDRLRAELARRTPAPFDMGQGQ